MSIAGLINRLWSLGLVVEEEDGHLKVKGPKGALTPELSSVLKDKRSELLYFLRSARSGQMTDEVIPQISGEGPYQVSYGQKRLWILQQSEPGMISYNEQSVTLFDCSLERGSFELAFGMLMERHEILRTTLEPNASGEPVQHVHPWPWSKGKMRYIEVGKECSAERLGKKIKEEAHQVFDLAEGPLIRSLLVKDGEGYYTFVLTMHHIISDAWSMGIIVREMKVLYEACKEGRENPLPPLSIQFKDFAAWQNHQVQGGKMEKHRAYWTDQLKGEIPSFILPNDYPLATVKTHEGASLQSLLLGESFSSLLEWASSKKVSTFSILLACFKVLVLKVTGQSDILIGAMVAGRGHDSLKDLVGFFVNTVMLRNKVDPEQSFDYFLSNVNKRVVEAVNHQSYPLECILEDLNLSKDYMNSPISSVFFNKVDFQRNRGEGASGYEGYGLPRKFDLEFHIQEYKDAIEINFIYKKELYKKETVAYLMGCFDQLLREVQKNPFKKIKLLSLQPGIERFYSKKHETASVEGMFSSRAIEQSISKRFEEIVGIFPHKVAVRDRKTTFTYLELNRESNRLGWKIIEMLGKSRPYCVALLLGQNASMTIAVMGVLKSGHVYVPLDPSFPEKRLTAILEDTEARVFITDKANKELVTSLLRQCKAQVSVIILEELSGSLPTHDPQVDIDSLDPAYILYTSGSTGTPKGVLQLQRNVLHFIRVYTNNLSLNPQDRLSLLPYYTFDASIMDIFGALLNGASLHIFDFKKEGVGALKEWVNHEQITVLHLVPTLFRFLIKAMGKTDIFPLVRLLVLGGEAVVGTDFQLFKKHFSTPCLFVNGLGPTESTVTLQLICQQDDDLNVKSVPVGYAVQDTQVDIVDDESNMLDIWGVGEIVYKSEYLSPGYINNPEMTVDFFPIDQDFRKLNTYKSGDLGRKLPDGSIEFMGRKDAQVKLRGVRVEVVEIERALKGLQSIKDAVVVEKDINGSQQLVAYFTAISSLPISELKRNLLQVLPHFMVPPFYVELVDLPINANGKIDRKALPEPIVNDRPAEGTPVALTSTEKRLTRIWHELFGNNNVGIDEDFFVLGGNSLKATQLIYYVHKEFEVRLDFQAIFLHTTIRQLGMLLESSGKLYYSDIEPAEIQDHYSVSHTQKRMWILNQMEDERQGYLLSGIYEIKGDFDVLALEKSVNQVVLRHESLRTVFKEINGEPRQVILRDIGFDVVFEDWRNSTEATTVRQRESVVQDSEMPFDLAHGPLLRLKVFQMEDDEYVMLFSMHHIVSDAWSFGVLIREVFTLYGGFKNKVELVLPPLSIQYKDYVQWQNKRLRGERLFVLKQYWQNLFKDHVPELQLPLDFPRPPFRTLECGDRGLLFPKPLSEAVKLLARQKKTSMYNVLLSAFSIVLYKHTDQKDMVIASPVSGRSHQHLEHLIGLFINVLPYRVQLDVQDTFSDTLEKVKLMVGKCLEHQEYPFDLMVKDLKVERSSNRSVFYDVGFTWRDSHELPDFTHLGFEIRPLIKEIRTNQTDLLLACADTPEGINLNMTYNIKLFKPATIDEILADIKDLLEKCLANQELTLVAYSSARRMDEIAAKKNIFPELDL